jgi:plastocyanin
VGRKNRIGLWISLTILSFVAVLILTAYNRISFPSTNAEAMRPQDPFNLKFEGNCLVCHAESLPDITWYCHGVLPTESYYTRMYLQAHIYWVTSTLIIPQELYLPLVIQPSQNEVQVHLFGFQVLPVIANITVGTTVTWTNLDIRAHTLLSDYAPHNGPFGRLVLKPGESISYTFEKTGVFAYRYQYPNYASSVTGLYQVGIGKIVITK